ncbi:MAG: AAA family ATPase, partial [Candidatus Brocadiae bacterium]|nr:AAA family ATPase [Candidatus Brocadiia bacterium]
IDGKKTKRLRTMGAGSVVGESGLYMDATRSATVSPRAGDPAGVTKLREGLALFVSGAFEEAAGALAEAASLLPLDTVAPRFLARCQARLAEASEAKAEILKLDARDEEKTALAAPVSPPGTQDRLQPSDGALPVITPEDLGSLDVERQARVPAVRPPASAPPPQPPPQSPAVATGTLPFIGRANTLQAMDRALDDMPRGRGGFLLVRGRPGVGKTRLLEEFVRRHSYRNAVFLRATCSGDLGDYFGPWKDLAWDALKSVEDAGMQAFVRLSMRFAPEFGRFGERFRRLAQSHGRNFDTTAGDERVRSLLVDLFAAVLEHRSLVVVLDALESADSETLAVLELLAALAKDRPLILLGAASQSRAADTNPWVRSYGSLRARKLAQEFLLPRLPEDEVRKLLGPLFGRELGRSPDLEILRADARIAGEVSRASEGNIHQLEKICRHLASTGLVAEDGGLWKLTKRGPLTEDDLVSGLSDALFARYRALNSRQSAVLRWLSLSEDGVPFDALAEVTGLGQAELFHAVHELAAQKLCIETDERGRKIPSIPSPLLRQKIAAEIPPPERPGLHDRIAAALERCGA